MSQVVTRFAPSPTGLMHLGHAYAAWIAWRRAREAAGRFLLRLEDIDQGRCRPEYAEAIEEDLRWLGLDWYGAVLVQSGRGTQYAAALEALRARGLAYPCFCSRQDILREVAGAGSAPHGISPEGAPLYPGTCRALGSAERQRRLEQGVAHAWRLDMGAAMLGAPPLYYLEEGAGTVACRPEQFGDAVLWRRDALGSYHLCVTYDDAAQGISLVTRGEDLRHATALHRLLQHVMGWESPAYAHHRLLTDEHGRRLAKRDGATAIRSLREQGLSREAVLASAGCVPD